MRPSKKVSLLFFLVKNVTTPKDMTILHFRSAYLTSNIGKVCYSVYAVPSSLMKILYWLFHYIPKEFRQHPEWTYHQAVANQVMYTFLYQWSILELRTSLHPPRIYEGDRFITIPPSKPSFYTGVLSHPTIHPTAISGVWYPSTYHPHPSSTRKIVLYIHGGAFILGTARPHACAFPATTFARAFNAHVLAFSYRLACNPNCSFPAAIQDTLTAYLYLLNTLQIEASRIVLAGDSAGCALALALLRYITTQPDLPTPKAAVLCSPWLNICAALDPDFLNMDWDWDRPLARTDYIPLELLAWGAKAYCPSPSDSEESFRFSGLEKQSGEEDRWAYISPFGHPFATETQLIFCVGGQEGLRKEAVEFAQAMRGVRWGRGGKRGSGSGGNKIVVFVEEKANHGFVAVGHLMGFRMEAERVVGKAARVILGRGA